MDEPVERFEITNTSQGTRVIHVAGRPVVFAPGQARVVSISPRLARQISGRALRVSGIGGGIDPEPVKPKPQVPEDENPVAIEALASKAEAGEIEWSEFQKEANAFLPTPMPAKKADIIAALRARAKDLRAKQA